MALEGQLQEAESKMKKAVQVAKEDFSSIRTGRASPLLLEKIQVDYYGTPTPLNQLAGISVPEARMMVVSPYDRNALSAIEKAILASDLGITPNNDGSVLRIVFPPLTEERRKEFVKTSHQRGEDGKVALRNVRRHVKEEMESLQKEGEISEDDLMRGEKELQRLTDHYVHEIDALMEHKEKELLED
ncbi:MAG: ribosome recycling factor [Actinobacteria bacterium]|nr:ribosome recycling factor [Actinomycetota bacterium]